MSREKQIEEMAKILCGMKNGCDGCMWNKVYCNERNYAEEIYNAGYRKQSELTPCDVCQFSPPSSTDGKPCSVCPAQAKMKGGAE